MKLLKYLIWAVVIFIALGTPFEVLEGQGPDIAKFRTDAQSAKGTIDQLYIDGLGGDLTASWHYKVNGVTYYGSGNSSTVNLRKLNQGDSVTIQYSKAKPYLSCLCDAATANYWELPYDQLNYWGFLSLAPLVVWIIYLRRKKNLKKRATKPTQPAAQF